jgi:hypothetical protein
MKVLLQLLPKNQHQTTAFISKIRNAFKKKKPIPKPSGKPQVKHEMNLHPRKQTQQHRSDRRDHKFGNKSAVAKKRV